jgi:hypothetical protein
LPFSSIKAVSLPHQCHQLMDLARNKS